MCVAVQVTQRQQQQRLLQAQQGPKTVVVTTSAPTPSTTPIMTLVNNTKLVKVQPVRPNGVRSAFQAIEISIVSI